MSQTKYKLPTDLKSECISIVRGYERRVRLYHQRREKVIYGSPTPDGQPRGNTLPDITQDKAIRLEVIESSFDTRAMRAVEHARAMVGIDLADESARQILRAAIMDSCLKGRNFCFGYWPLTMERDNFYERRRRFLYDIANYLGFL